MKKSIAVFICFCVLSFVIKAQNPDAIEELKKIRAFYSGPELKHITGEMLLKNKGSGKVVDNVKFEYWVKDSMVYTKMNYIEILRNQTVYVMVNHKSKSIYARMLNQINTQPSSMLFDADQLKKLLSAPGAKVIMTKEGEKSKLYMEGFADPRYSSVSLTYDPSDHKIFILEAAIKETAEGANGQKLVLRINYKTTEKSKTLNTSIFSSSRYFVQEKKSVKYINPYQNYSKL